MSIEELNTPFIFLTHTILFVVDEIVYATIVIRRLTTREIFRSLASLRSARVLTYISLVAKQCAYYNRCINYYFYTAEFGTLRFLLTIYYIFMSILNV
jgi:hypothetical protein